MDTPVPIPNTAVKHYNADGSTFSCARVGNCQAVFQFNYGGLAQLGEHLPYKQRVSGSSPLTSTILYLFKCAEIAQLVEQLTCNQ